MTFRATISKDYNFSASHRLPYVEPGHPCGNWHGHNYIVRLTLSGHVGSSGMVVDYRTLDQTFGKWLDDTLDHAGHLNDLCLSNPHSRKSGVLAL